MRPKINDEVCNKYNNVYLGTITEIYKVGRVTMAKVMIKPDLIVKLKLKILKKI